MSRRSVGASHLLTTAALVYAADRITKLWAESALRDGPIEVIPGLLTLRFTSNPGGAFSFGTSIPWFFALAQIGVSVAIVATAFRPRPLPQALALGLILGGALGNLTDRLTRGTGLGGEVIDFIDVGFWPVFNVADSAIVIGAILLALSSIGSSRARPDGEAASGDAG